VPAANVLVGYEATAFTNVTGPPTGVPSTLNCTVPVGTAVPWVGATVAVKVTDCPYTDGFNELVTVVVVAAATPVAVSWIVWVEPGIFSELSVTTAVPVIAPACSGLKSIASVQSAPEARVCAPLDELSCGQLVDELKAKFVLTLGLLPLDGGKIGSAALPIFERRTDCGLSVESDVPTIVAVG
jgi:hypothetical protein